MGPSSPSNPFLPELTGPSSPESPFPSGPSGPGGNEVDTGTDDVNCDYLGTCYDGQYQLALPDKI